MLNSFVTLNLSPQLSRAQAIYVHPASVSRQTLFEEHIATIERLLRSIARIRGEHDRLRRDFEFLNVKNKFTVQSLEAKLAAASAPLTPSANSTHFSQISTLEGTSKFFEGRAEHNSRTTLAVAIVAQRTVGQEEDKAMRIQSLLPTFHRPREPPTMELHLQERQDAIESLETPLSSSTTLVGEAESQVAAFRTTIQRLAGELARKRHSHIETGAALTHAEAARDALTLEKTHLEADLESAREEFADAEARYAS